MLTYVQEWRCRSGGRMGLTADTRVQSRCPCGWGGWQEGAHVTPTQTHTLVRAEMEACLLATGGGRGEGWNGDGRSRPLRCCVQTSAMCVCT